MRGRVVSTVRGSGWVSSEARNPARVVWKGTVGLSDPARTSRLMRDSPVGHTSQPYRALPRVWLCTPNSEPLQAIAKQSAKSLSPKRQSSRNSIRDILPKDVNECVLIPEGSQLVAGGGAVLATPPVGDGISGPRQGSQRRAKHAGAPAGARNLSFGFPVVSQITLNHRLQAIVMRYKFA
jgi:hypothetical protein